METVRKLLFLVANGLANVLFFIFFVLITPLLFLLYLLCWIRAKITALVVLNDKQTLFNGEDVIPMLDNNPINSLINVAFLFQDQFTVDNMKELFVTKVIKAKDDNDKPQFPKFTRHITICADYLVWSDENHFNIDDHIRLHHGQRPRDEVQLKKLFNDICNDALPRSKPCWEILIIPLEYGHENDPKTCILFRVDHSIADGVSLGRLIFEEIGGADGIMKTVFKHMDDKVKPKCKSTLLMILENLVLCIFSFIVAPASMCKQVLIRDRNILHGPTLSGALILDWKTAIKLSHVKDIKNATCTTVNDVFMSCIAATLRKYFVQQNVSPPASLHVAFPVNLQHPDDPIGMKNKISFVISRLPTEDMDCLQRLRTTKALMDNLKRSPDVIINRWFIQYCVSVIPYSIMRFIMNQTPASIIVSNLPGPLSSPAFNGHPLQTVVALGQIRGATGVGMVVISYAGDVIVSVTVDKAIISREDSVRCLLDGFVEEMQQLYKTVVETPLALREKKLH